jgi:outer membrane protein insertion porin family
MALALLLSLTGLSAFAASDTVVQIRFQGLYRVEAESVNAVLYTRVGDSTSSSQLQKDVRAIYDLGYFTDVQVDMEQAANGVVVTYIVEERPSVKEVKLEGNDEIGDDDIMEVVDIKQHSVLSYAKIYKNIDKIRNLYIEKGFFLADVEFEVKETDDNQVIIVFKINERAKVVVKKIILLGNEKIKDSDLLGIMVTKPGDALSFITNSGQFRQEMVERDAYVIAEYYANHGYLNATVASPQVYLSPDRKWVYVTFRIHEGEQYTLGSLDFSGDLLFPKKKLHKSTKLKPGKIFNRGEFLQDLERVADLYKDLGYAYTNVTPITKADEEALSVAVDMRIQKGSKVWVERINVVGNTKTRDKVIRREMRIAEGDLYSSSAIKKSRFKINQLGFFEEVDITEEPGSGPDKIVLTVRVKERRTGTFQIGFGFSSIDSFVFQAQVNQSNLFGRGQSLSLQAQLSSRRTQFMLRFFEPYLADSKVNFGFTLFNQSYTYPTQGEFGSYSRASSGADVTFGYPILDDVTLFLTYSIKDTDLDVDNQVHLHLFKSGLTSSFTLTGQYDSRDNRMFPTAGMLHSLSLEYADDYTGSDIEFMKAKMTNQFFFPIWWKLVFKINAELGYIKSLEEPDASKDGPVDFPGVAIAERFLLGGIYTVRGFEFGSISPSIEVIPQNDPAGYPVKYLIGGNKEFFVNFELEFPVIEQAGIRWVFFYDMGNTWSENEQFFYIGQSGVDRYNLPLGLYMSAGFGFRWYSPIGPLRFEWGLPITRRPQDDLISFEFSIGNQF